jgi:hypothetical protein
LPGQHRFVFDTTNPDGFGGALLYANNFFLANQNGYGLGNAELAVVIVVRHNSTLFGYNDAIWAKYGTVLGNMAKVTDPRTNQPPTVNPLNSSEFGAAMTNLGVTAAALAKRGAHFAICDMATNRIAGVIAQPSGFRRRSNRARMRWPQLRDPAVQVA